MSEPDWVEAAREAAAAKVLLRQLEKTGRVLERGGRWFAAPADSAAEEAVSRYYAAEAAMRACPTAPADPARMVRQVRADGIPHSIGDCCEECREVAWESCFLRGQCRRYLQPGDLADDVLDLALAEADRLYSLWQGAQQAIDEAWREIPFASESPNTLTEEVRALVKRAGKQEGRVVHG